jgi:hypothetical protein
MGVSTNAVLFYGYCWQDECRLFDDSQGWDRLAALKRGHKDPWDDFPKDLGDSSHPNYVRDYHARNAAIEKWKAGHRAELDGWHELLRGIEAEFGVELDSHCSGECPMPCLYVKGTETTARRGYPVEMNPDTDFAIGADWQAKLDRWLAEFGVEKPHPEPKWWLVSYWG